MEHFHQQQDNTNNDEIRSDHKPQTRPNFFTPIRQIKDVVKEHLLPYLPAKTLARFRSVSKDWDYWITTPLFAHQHSYTHNHLSGFFCQTDYQDPTFISLDPAAYGVPSPSLDFLPEPVDIRSSTNGLLLCQGTNFYYICNPVTKKFMELNEPTFYHGTKPAIVLAFEPSVLDIEAHYEVICAFLSTDQPVVYFEHFSSLTMSWRTSRDWWIALDGEPNGFSGDGFFIKGVAYWVLSCKKVVAFDLKDKLCGVICLPDDSPEDGVLANIEDEVHYIGISCEYDSVLIYGGATMMTLRQRIGIHAAEGSRILPCVRRNVVTILVGYCVYSYSLREGDDRILRAEMVSCRGVQRFDCWNTTRFLPYVNSLASVAWV